MAALVALAVLAGTAPAGGAQQQTTDVGHAPHMFWQAPMPKHLYINGEGIVTPLDDTVLIGAFPHVEVAAVSSVSAVEMIRFCYTDMGDQQHCLEDTDRPSTFPFGHLDVTHANGTLSEGTLLFEATAFDTDGRTTSIQQTVQRI